MTPTPPRAPRQFPNFGRPVRRTRNTVTFDSSPVIVTPTQGYPPPSSVALNLTPSTPTVNGGYNGSDDEIEEDEEEDEGVNGHDHDEERQDDEDEDVHDMDDEDDEVGDEVDGDEHGGEEGDIEGMFWILSQLHMWCILLNFDIFCSSHGHRSAIRRC